MDIGHGDIEMGQDLNKMQVLSACQHQITTAFRLKAAGMMTVWLTRHLTGVLVANFYINCTALGITVITISAFHTTTRHITASRCHA